uniref:Cytochrome P450 3026D3 n=1 Tax=Paracyclopina nana TaxID=565004 RepID=A0A0F7J1U6_PARNA|nr:cytochrome P450 3026D3 [Paracyclopina nana]
MLIEIIALLATLTVAAYIYLQVKWTYWSKRGVFFLKPTFPFGSIPSFFTKSKHLNDEFYSHIEKTKPLPYYGIYFIGGATLIINDADLAKNILVKDFDYFVDRNGDATNKLLQTKHKTDIIWTKQMTMSTGEYWKNLRSTFSPIFTSGKMKAMMVFIQETSDKLMQAIDAKVTANEDFELKEMLGKYSMDTIASCAFGVDAESFSNKDSKFVQYASNIFKNTTMEAVRFLIILLPLGKSLLNFLNVPMFKVTETEFFYDAVVASLNHRRETKTRRNDLIDLMLDAIKGEVAMDEHKDEDDQFEKDAALNHVPKKGEFDELVIVATAIVLMVAGYDTTGTTLAYACYQLSKNPDIQDRLRAEIEEVTGDSDMPINYESIQKMNYLDQIISETLRFCSPIAIIQRNTTKDYKIPGHDLVIEKGNDVWINVMQMHTNPKYYPNPHEFNPDHFTREAKANRNPCAFLPFGQGPRGCLGMRFALLEAKLALANIIRRYNLHPSEKTKEPTELDPYSGIAYVKHGLYVRAEKRY